jgi:hypothetical protein
MVGKDNNPAGSLRCNRRHVSLNTGPGWLAKGSHKTAANIVCTHDRGFSEPLQLGFQQCPDLVYPRSKRAFPFHKNQPAIPDRLEFSLWHKAWPSSIRRQNDGCFIADLSEQQEASVPENGDGWQRMPG